MNCTPQALLQAAACYRCIPKPVMRSTMISLLCEWANQLAPPFSYEPQTELISWIDSGGNHTGDLATFYFITATTGIDTVTSVNAGGNPITSVSNVSSLPALVFFDFSSTIISSLDVTGCTILDTLLVNDTNLTSVTGLATCTSLVTFQCQNSSMMGSLDVSGLSNLNLVYCYSNSLSSLDCSNCTSLTTLNCSFNLALTTLTLAGCTALVALDCRSCDLNGTLDLSALSSLVSVNCSSNFSSSTFTDLILTGLSNLTTLAFNDCTALVNVNLTGCTALTSIVASGCYALVSLDVSGFASLTSLDAGFDYSLQSFLATGCTSLTTLILDYAGNLLVPSPMTSVDLSTCTAMAFFSCGNVGVLPGSDCALNDLRIGDSTNYTTVVAMGCNLPANPGGAPEGINNILSKLSINCLGNAGTIDLTGGTNSPPDGTAPSGIAAKILLNGAGWSVLTN